MNAHVQRQLEDQRTQWNAVANGWATWWSHVERSAQTVSDLLVARAAVAEGDTVVDVATGIGEPAVTAARRVGSDGRVVATDQAADMLAIARTRVQGAGLCNVEFAVTNGVDLDLPDGDADAVLCRWGLMFFPEPIRALTEMRRVLRPHGRVALAIWPDPARVPMLSLPMRVLGRALDLPHPPAGSPGPFALADRGRVRRILEDAGFEDIHLESTSIVPTFESPQEFTDMLVDVVGPIRHILAGRSPDVREGLLRRIQAAAAEFAGPDQTIKFSCAVTLAHARKPF